MEEERARSVGLCAQARFGTVLQCAARRRCENDTAKSSSSFRPETICRSPRCDDSTTGKLYRLQVPDSSVVPPLRIAELHVSVCCWSHSWVTMNGRPVSFSKSTVICSRFLLSPFLPPRRNGDNPAKIHFVDGFGRRDVSRSRPWREPLQQRE